MGKYVVYTILLAFVGANIYMFFPSIQRSRVKMERIDKRVLEINSKIAGYDEKIAEYDEKIGKLKIDFYREKLGREKLQMVKEGEKIYKVTN